jgi:hypothetical protein
VLFKVKFFDLILNSTVHFTVSFTPTTLTIAQTIEMVTPTTLTIVPTIEMVAPSNLTIAPTSEMSVTFLRLIDPYDAMGVCFPLTSVSVSISQAAKH